MSEKENTHLAEQAISALNAHDLDRFVKLLDSSYVLELELAQGKIHGPDGARQHLEAYLKAFPDLRIDVEQIIASGDHVVVRARVTGTQKGNFMGIAPTNKMIKWQVCDVFEVKNGKMVRDRVYAENAKVFQQLGVLSMPRTQAAG